MEKIKLILVDDNPADALLAIRIINKKRSEYEVIFIDEGQSLLDYLLMEKPPHAIFLDMHMPGMSGMDVLRKLRKITGFSSIPIIMLTSSMYEKDITETYRLGVSGYIVKPLSEQKLFDVLMNLNETMSN